MIENYYDLRVFIYFLKRIYPPWVWNPIRTNRNCSSVFIGIDNMQHMVRAIAKLL